MLLVKMSEQNDAAFDAFLLEEQPNARTAAAFAAKPETSPMLCIASTVDALVLNVMKITLPYIMAKDLF